MRRIEWKKVSNYERLLRHIRFRIIRTFTEFFVHRHQWILYQRFCRILKRLMGKRIFYTLQTFPEFCRTIFYIRRAVLYRWLRLCMGKKQGQAILIIDQGIPRFDHNSGDRRISEVMNVLRQMGQKITFFPFDGIRRPSYEAHLKKQEIGSVQTDLLTHLKRKGFLYDAIILCRVTIADKCIDDVKRYAPQASLIFDTVDIHHLRMERRAAIVQTDAARAEAREYKEVELRIMKKTDCTLVVSQPERAYVESLLPDVRVFVVSNILDIRQKPVWSETRQRLLFVGNLHHKPNSDAVRWFAEDILPILRQSLPSVELDVVGDYDEKCSTVLQKDGIRLHGHQPSIEPFFQTARVCVAPLRFGAGVKGKLHMSMSEGVPFVTTRIGAEGMFLTNGKDAIIADTPEDFAAGIKTLWTDPILWEKMATASQDVLLTHFSTQVAEQELRQMFGWLKENRKRSATIRS